MTKYKLIEGIPSIKAFNNLRVAVKWPPLDEDILTKALQASLFAVYVEVNGETIAMARVVGDGAMYVYLQDFIVHPDYQNHGIGKQIMNRISNYLNSSLNDGAFVGLMAAKGKEEFYRRFGFIGRPNEEYGSGMGKYLRYGK